MGLPILQLVDSDLEIAAVEVLFAELPLVVGQITDVELVGLWRLARELQG